jgi:ABC-type multidrug transport system ATPase subunit
MSRTADEITQAHAACLNGANTINSVIATHAKGDSATDEDFGYDLTHDEKKERVSRSVGYLKHQKDTYSDWSGKDFTAINAAITAADSFTG